jgi:hypothetical protein
MHVRTALGTQAVSTSPSIHTNKLTITPALFQDLRFMPSLPDNSNIGRMP